jgi:hypothetical protein
MIKCHYVNKYIDIHQIVNERKTCNHPFLIKQPTAHNWLWDFSFINHALAHILPRRLLMTLHRSLRFFLFTLISEVLFVFTPAVTSALDSSAQEENIYYPDIIDTLEVVDSLDEHSLEKIRRSDIELDPASLYQDVYKHALATKPLANAYGPFSAQLSLSETVDYF